LISAFCDKIFHTLFRLQGAHNREAIHRFLFQIAAHYNTQTNAVDFIIDLLRVEALELLLFCPTKIGEMSQEDGTDVHVFVQNLQNYIAENKLKHQLLHQMKEILVRIIH